MKNYKCLVNISQKNIVTQFFYIYLVDFFLSKIMDPKYSALRKLYAFEPGNLKQKFLKCGDQTFFDNCLFSKQYDMLNLRIKYSRLFKPQELLFSFFKENTTSDPNNEKALAYFVDYKFIEESNFFISDVFATGFPDFYFIPDFFCHSTFPSMFGHFTSSEYLMSGYNFLLAHIKDPLAPQLLSVYLCHCFQFQDRLLCDFFTEIQSDGDLFYSKSSNDNDKSDKILENGVRLRERFIESFKCCISCFTEYHIKIVNEFRRKNDMATVKYFLKLFVNEIISLWKFSPILYATGVIGKLKGPKNPTCYSNVDFEFIFDNFEFQKIFENPELLLDLFVDDIVTVPPAISDITYTDGCTFVISAADFSLILALFYHETGKDFKEIHDSSFLDNFFTLYIRIKRYPKSVSEIKEPEQTPGESGLTLEKLKEHKEFHQFLYDRSGGMKQLQLTAKATQSVLKLKIREFVDKIVILKYESPKQFLNRQYSLFIDKFLRKLSERSTDMLNLLNKPGQLGTIETMLNYPLYKDSLIHESVLKVADGYFKMLKNSLDQKQSDLLADKMHHVMFELFEEIIEPISLEFFLRNSSILPKIQILNTAGNNMRQQFKPSDNLNDEIRDSRIHEIVNDGTFHERKVLSWVQSECINVRGYFTEVHKIISLFNSHLKYEFTNKIDAFGIGEKINAFVELQEIVEMSFKETMFEDDDELSRYFVDFVFEGEKFDHIKAYLLIVNKFMHSLMNTEKNFCTPTVEMYVNKLDFLNRIFNLHVE
ncbi:hypothetical protein TRFO_22912 [Tritrichomonas foetus]|uniref:Uncharacterized protein n=1 Tax=Tritrichomonas foetus TaxID=1144522 RepID=A0A1J4KGP8_9EUKA|nr:hypothetical protein TRFO_22912 [Tritrichomonas foetus]|eukprot:OHT08501.1 hypothetical protein TRFO_22912 [Tritrichomonas foetus]